MLNNKRKCSIKEQEKQLLPILKRRGAIPENFRKLNNYSKDILYKKICLGIDKLTGIDRDEILQMLVVGEARDGISPVDLMTDEQKRAFFDEEPIDWGC